MYCGGMKWLHRSDLARELCVESLDIDRRVVTAAHIIVGVQHQSRTVVIYLRRHGHHFLSRNTVSWRPARSTHEHRILTPPTKLFTKNPAIYTTFPRSTKHVYTSLACSQDFSKIATNTVLGITQLWFNFFRVILAYTLLGMLSKEVPR